MLVTSNINSYKMCTHRWYNVTLVEVISYGTPAAAIVTGTNGCRVRE